MARRIELPEMPKLLASRHEKLAIRREKNTSDRPAVRSHACQHRPRLRIPNFGGPILTAAGQASAVRGKGHGLNCVLMPLQAGEFPACGRIPKFHGGVRTAASQDRPIGRESDGVGKMPMSGKLELSASLGHVPNLHGVFERRSPDGHQLAVRRQRHVAYLPRFQNAILRRKLLTCPGAAKNDRG
jgi:hypothetical protein